MPEGYFQYQDIFQDGSNISLAKLHEFTINYGAKLQRFPLSVAIIGPTEIEWIEENRVRIQFTLSDATVLRWVDAIVDKIENNLEVNFYETGTEHTLN